jgi:hypothetical protein
MPFCVKKPGRRLIIESEYGLAVWGRHTSSKGHFLAIPYRLRAGRPIVDKLIEYNSQGRLSGSPGST